MDYVTDLDFLILVYRFVNHDKLFFFISGYILKPYYKICMLIGEKSVCITTKKTVTDRL